MRLDNMLIAEGVAGPEKGGGEVLARTGRISWSGFDSNLYLPKVS